MASQPNVGLGRYANDESPAARHQRMYGVKQLHPQPVGSSYKPAFGFLKDTKPAKVELNGNPAVRKQQRKEQKIAARKVQVKNANNKLAASALVSHNRITGVQFLAGRNIRPNRPVSVTATRVDMTVKADFRDNNTGLNAVPAVVRNDILTKPASAVPAIATGSTPVSRGTYDDLADAVISVKEDQVSAAQPAPSKKVAVAVVAVVALACFFVWKAGR